MINLVGEESRLRCMTGSALSTRCLGCQVGLGSEFHVKRRYLEPEAVTNIVRVSDRMVYVSTSGVYLKLFLLTTSTLGSGRRRIYFKAWASGGSAHARLLRVVGTTEKPNTGRGAKSFQYVTSGSIQTEGFLFYSKSRRVSYERYAIQTRLQGQKAYSRFRTDTRDGETTFPGTDVRHAKGRSIGGDTDARIGDIGCTRS